ncbi:terpene synthase family protein [Amycolatopsis lurida]
MVPRLAVVETGFPRELDPNWSELRELSHAWAADKRIMAPEVIREQADGLRYTDLIAGVYVGSPAPVLSAIIDFSVWFFAWDDRHDRDAAHRRDECWTRLSGALRAALEAPLVHMRHPDPLVAAFADAIGRLYTLLGDRWNARFADHFGQVIDAYGREYRNRMTGTVPTVADYLELRPLTFAHEVWLDLLEPAARYELPRHVVADDAYRRAGQACQDFAAWYNDLCSLPKEIAAAEPHNLGVSLIHHEGLSVSRATAEVRRRVVVRVADFLDAEADVHRLVAGAAPGLRRAVRYCLRGMRNWISSSYWFHHESDRYRVDTWDDPSLPPYLKDLVVPDECGQSTADP